MIEEAEKDRAERDSAQLRDAVIRRMAAMPPKPHKPKQESTAESPRKRGRPSNPQEKT
jgi:hypothetical protein